MDRLLLYGVAAMIGLLPLSRAYSTGTPAKALRHLRKDETLIRSVLESFLPIVICLSLVFTVDLILLIEFFAVEGTVLFALHLLTLLLLYAAMATICVMPSYVVIRHWRDQRDAKAAKARARRARK